MGTGNMRDQESPLMHGEVSVAVQDPYCRDNGEKLRPRIMWQG